MIISTKGRNAIKLMLDLAIYNSGTPVKIKDIAERQEMSEKYLEQIVAPLNKAGLVKRIRGAKGGYLLNDNPNNYTVGRILKVVEGNVSAVDYGDNKELPADIVSKMVWDKLDEAINSVLEGITLADLLEMYNDIGVDYCI